MRQVLYLGVCVVCLAIFASCSSRSNLYEHTDYFVDQLSTTYQSYGL